MERGLDLAGIMYAVLGVFQSAATVFFSIALLSPDHSLRLLVLAFGISAILNILMAYACLTRRRWGRYVACLYSLIYILLIVVVYALSLALGITRDPLIGVSYLPLVLVFVLQAAIFLSPGAGRAMIR